MEQKMVYKNRWFTFTMVALITLANCVDMSALNVALPTLADDLHISMAQVELIVTINLLVIISLILIFGKLGDVKGKDKIFQIGIFIFMMGAIISFLAHSYILLIVGRVVAAVGSACSNSTNQGIIAEVFPANARGKALGIHGSLVALGIMLGPSLGGFIVENFGWNMIFLMYVPICAIDLVLCWKFMPKLSRAAKGKTDYRGSALFIVFIATVYLLVKKLQVITQEYKMVVILLVVAVLFGILFARAEKKTDEPMLDLSLFRNKLFTVSVLCSFLSFFALSSNNFILPFYLQKTLDYSPALSGRIMMIYPVIMIIVAPFSGSLSDKIGSEILGVIGLGFGVTGIAIMATLTEFSSPYHFIIGLVCMALGFSAFQSPNTALIMGTVPQNKLGAAGSLNGLTRNMGNVFGISLSTTILYNLMSWNIGYTTTDYIVGRDDVFIFGMHGVYGFAAILVAIGWILSVIRWRARKNKKAAN